MKKIYSILFILFCSLICVGQIDGKSDYTINNGLTVVVEGDLIINNYVQINISNNAILVVKGNLTIKPNATISLSNNAKLIVGGNMTQKSDGILLGLITTTTGDVNADNNAKIIVFGDYNIEKYNGRYESSSLPSNSKAEIYSNGGNYGTLASNNRDVDALNETLKKQASILLPIELTSFTALQNGEEIEIVWTTNSEVNNDYFTVEYSVDGVSFKTLETVAGSGTTSEINEYAISVNASNFSGLVYFRLKQTDYNGEYSYSDVIALQVESANATDLVIYPNPATEYITISGAVTSAFVSDMHGRRIAVPQTSANTFNVAGLSVGTYYMVATTENGKTVLPFVKE